MKYLEDLHIHNERLTALISILMSYKTITTHFEVQGSKIHCLEMLLFYLTAGNTENLSLSLLVDFAKHEMYAVRNVSAQRIGSSIRLA